MPSLTEPETRSVPIDRSEVLREIAFHERCAEELRASLVSPVKLFFKFRCRPERQVMIYAADREQAVARLHERMARDYGNAWQCVSTHVDTYADPNEAAVNAPANLLRCIPVDQAREFVRDYRDQQRGQVAKPNEFGSMPQLDKDVLDFERGELQRKG